MFLLNHASASHEIPLFDWSRGHFAGLWLAEIEGSLEGSRGTGFKISCDGSDRDLDDKLIIWSMGCRRKVLGVLIWQSAGDQETVFAILYCFRYLEAFGSISILTVFAILHRFDTEKTNKRKQWASPNASKNNSFLVSGTLSYDKQSVTLFWKHVENSLDCFRWFVFSESAKHCTNSNTVSFQIAKPVHVLVFRS